MRRILRLGAVLAVGALLVTACSSSTSGSSSTSPASGAPSSMSEAPAVGDVPGKLKAVAAIPGVAFIVEIDRSHVAGTVRYSTSPPVGGPHSPIPADCMGTVYPNPIANENAVHSLEHGAVWVTYRPGLASDQVAVLAKLVQGRPYTMMSPYPGLSGPISVQSWGYQLRVDKASDPRLRQFVELLANNPQTTPEFGASCSDPPFKANPSTPGHPIDG